MDIIHIVALNGFTMLNDPHFAVLEQLVVNVEVNTTFTHHEDRQKKQMVEIPLGFHVFIPTIDESVTLKLSQEAKNVQCN